MSRFSQLKEELEKMGYSKKTCEEITGWYNPHKRHQNAKKKLNKDKRYFMPKSE